MFKSRVGSPFHQPLTVIDPNWFGGFQSGNAKEPEDVIVAFPIKVQPVPVVAYWSITGFKVVDTGSPLG